MLSPCPVFSLLWICPIMVTAKRHTISHADETFAKENSFEKTSEPHSPKRSNFSMTVASSPKRSGSESSEIAVVHGLDTFNEQSLTPELNGLFPDLLKLGRRSSRAYSIDSEAEDSTMEGHSEVEDSTLERLSGFGPDLTEEGWVLPAPPGSPPTRGKPLLGVPPLLRSNSNADEKASDVSDDPPLRVFAATYNGGNQVFARPEDAKGLLTDMLKGHEEVGKESDIVIIGLQEWSDDNYKIANMAAEEHLWRELAQRKSLDLQDEINKLLTFSDAAAEASQRLTSHLNDAHNKIRENIVEFIVHAKEAQDCPGCPDPFPDGSAGNVLAGKSAHEQIVATKRTIDAMWNEYSSAKLQGASPRLTSLWNNSTKMINQFPDSQSIHDMLEDMSDWKDSALVGLENLRLKYPNADFTEESRKRWQDMEQKLDYSPFMEAEYLSNVEARSALSMAISNIKTLSEGKLSQVEFETTKKLHEHFKQAIKSLNALDDDINELRTFQQERHSGESGESTSEQQLAADAIEQWKYFAQGRIQPSTPSQNHSNSHHFPRKKSGSGRKLQKNEDKVWHLLGDWHMEMTDRLAKFRAPKLYINKTDVRVKRLTQKYFSGRWCQGWSHYDTIMHVYVNPWSGWKVKAVEQHNINNNQKWECGKVVNLMVIEAEKSPVPKSGTPLGAKSKMTICAMNTHMSFGLPASQRREFIAYALQVAKRYTCDSVIFVGDFNSRLHCEPPLFSSDPDEPKSYPEVATFEKSIHSVTSIVPSVSSFNHVLNTFCDSNQRIGEIPNCSVTQHDELTHMMELDGLRCFEKNSKKQWQLHLEAQVPSLKEFGIREAAAIRFLPSYKLGTMKKAKKLGDKWSRCYWIQETNTWQCLVNKEGDGKHNPAWTDRILVQSVSPVNIATTEYSRRIISDPTVTSDHAPIVARLEIFRDKTWSDSSDWLP